MVKLMQVGLVSALVWVCVEVWRYVCGGVM